MHWGTNGVTGGTSGLEGELPYARLGSERQRGKETVPQGSAERKEPESTAWAPSPFPAVSCQEKQAHSTEQQPREQTEQPCKRLYKTPEKNSKTHYKENAAGKNVATEVDKVKIITQNSTTFFFFNSVRQLQF